MDSPIDILAAARKHPVGPFRTAREEWLKGWVGPCSPGDGDDGDDGDVAICDGKIVDDRWVGEPNGIRLDVRRPEVRDHLVRLGCPAWARDVPAAVWCWGVGMDAVKLCPPWVTWDGGRSSRGSGGPLVYIPGDRVGWRCRDETGPETGDLGRACADLAAIRAGCILEEPDGWYVPLVGGGVGWWAKEGSDAG